MELPQISGEALSEQLLTGHLDVVSFVQHSSAGGIQATIEYLKSEANRYWSIDPQGSLARAELIERIGQARGDRDVIALGTMARGDALKFLGQFQAAWDALEEAGRLFQSTGNELGWARTLIGPLYIAVELNRVEEALANSQKARAIFTRLQAWELLINLDINLSTTYTWLGKDAQALACLQSALHLAESLGPAGETYLGRLHLNQGVVLRQQGDFRRALDCFQRALSIVTARQESHWIVTTELNIAAILQAQGHYKQALRLLHDVQERLHERSPLQLADAQHNMVICYLALNRYREARDLAQQVALAYDALDAQYAKGRVLFNLATAEAALSNIDAALAALDEAERIMSALDTPLWLVTVCLWRGRIALKRGDTQLALQQVNKASQYAAQNAHHIGETDVFLLRGQVLLDLGDYPAAIDMGRRALQRAQRANQTWERYNAHLLLGQVHEAQHQPVRARRHYAAATATIDRMQRGLTITLRPGFMADKVGAMRALIRLHLNADDVTGAFETLERAKSQVFLSYLASHETLRWDSSNPHVRDLQQALERLREEHQWLSHRGQPDHPDGDGESGIGLDDATLEAIRIREKQMRTLTEQLYLYNPDDKLVDHSTLPSLVDIQRHLPEGTLLVEFYNDGNHLFAFKVDRRAIQVVGLDTPGTVVDRLLAQLQFNVACALRVDASAPLVNNLTQLAQRYAQQLYDALLAPLDIRFEAWQRLVIVPYGSLHYLPFHILHDRRAYLAERREIVTLPAAALITRQGPARTGGALVLAHSQQGLLPHTLSEAEAVHKLLGGEIRREELANRDALRLPPRQVLHIAAHGEFRIDQPDLAYIGLADGHLYTDDFLQHDLGYELITLSACETGRANVLAGEELIGLGRGCLYAGAGALLVSLWRVEDTTTRRLMDSVYRALCSGASKAAALRDAQRHLLAAADSPHPAYWGAFQLIGNAAPLSHPFR